MLRKALLIGSSGVAALALTIVVLYVRNPAPVTRAVSAADAANPTKPYVVKLHAQWCAVCMVTKSIWSDIEADYQDRVHLVVFDFTSDATAAASRAEAERLGLTKFFNENDGWTGTVAVVDGPTKEARAAIHGSRQIGEYRAAIDAALADARR